MAKNSGYSDLYKKWSEEEKKRKEEEDRKAQQQAAQNRVNEVNRIMTNPITGTEQQRLNVLLNQLTRKGGGQAPIIGAAQSDDIRQIADLQRQYHDYMAEINRQETTGGYSGRLRSASGYQQIQQNNLELYQQLLKQQEQSRKDNTPGALANREKELQAQLAAQKEYNADPHGRGYDGSTILDTESRIQSIQNRQNHRYAFDTSDPGVVDSSGFGSSREYEIQQELNRVQRQKWFADRQSKYNDYAQDPMFSQLAAYQNRDHAAQDTLYDSIFNPGKYKGTGSWEDDMTDAEKRMYVYIYNTQGREAAHDYLEYARYDVNARKNQEIAERAYNAGYGYEMPKNPTAGDYFKKAGSYAFGALASAASSPINVFTGGLGLVSAGAQKLRNAVTGENTPIDYNNAMFWGNTIASNIRGGMSQQITDDTGVFHLDEKKTPFLASLLNGKGLADVYQLGMSLVDSRMLAAATAPVMGAVKSSTAAEITKWASSAMLGGSAGTQAMLDAVSRGASDSQALTMGLLGAAAETVFEQFSLEAFINPEPGVGWKVWFKNKLKQGFTEGSEEFFTSIANLISDEKVMGAMSELAQKAQSYVDSGMSEDEAKRKAWQEFGVQIFWDFVGGAVMGSVGSVDGRNFIGELRDNRAYGKAVQSGDISLDTLKQIGARDVTPGSDAQKAIAALNDNSGTQALGKAARFAQQDLLEGMDSDNQSVVNQRYQRYQELLDKYKPAAETGRDAYEARSMQNLATALKRAEQESRPEQTEAEEPATTRGTTDAKLELTKVGEAGQKAVQSIYKQSNGETRFAEYADEFTSYYNAGLTGADMKSVKVENSLLSDQQQKAIYDAGRKDANRSLSGEVKAAKLQFNRADAGLDYSSVTKDSKVGRTDLRVLDRAAKSLGVRARFANLAAGQNGYIDADGTIVISNKASKPLMVVAAHEFTHRIQDVSPKAYREFRDFVAQAIERESVHGLQGYIQDTIEDYSKAGVSLGKEAAMDEIAANYAMQMMEDGKLYSSLVAQNLDLGHRMLNWLKSTIAKVRNALTGKGLSPEQVKAYGTSLATLEQAAKIWEKAYNEAVAAKAKLRTLNEDQIRDEMKKLGIAYDEQTAAETTGNDTTDGGIAIDQNGRRYSLKSMSYDIEDGKMFDDLQSVLGWSAEKTEALKENLIGLVKYIAQNREVLDMNETYGREGRKFSPFKPNSDPLYKISMDFSTLCSKRLLTQYVIEQLQLRENRPMTAKEQMAIREMLNEYRKQEKALKVACAMCYVEAARLKSPGQMERWMADPAAGMRDYFAKNNKEFKAKVNAAQGDFKESKGYSRDAVKRELPASVVTQLNKIGPKMYAEYQVSEAEQAIIDTAVSLPRSTYLTAGNLAELSENHPEIYAAYTTYVRNATRSKALETDEPYYYGDSTRDNGNGIVVSDTFIANVNAENGMRFSSWSDWRIQHLLDYMTAVIDLSVRKSAMHGYTKFVEEVYALGKTGMMFNLSGVPEGTNGLDADGNPAFSPTESVDIEKAKKAREDFPETAGIQCIGVSDDHIRKLLASDIIDYVIPYHTSGLNAELRRMAGILSWVNYTNVQHAVVDKSIKQTDDGVDTENWHKEPVFSEFFVGYDTEMSGIEAMRESAERYKQMCRERGLTPKFTAFATEENYWKLLIDRKMINQVTGELIQQRPVTPDFDFDMLKQIVDQAVENFDGGLEQRALNHIVENWDQLPAKIKELTAKQKAQKKAKSTGVAKDIDVLANEMAAAIPKENGRKKAAPKKRYSLQSLDIDRRYADYNDATTRRQYESETAADLVARGKVTVISKEAFEKVLSGTDWNDVRAARRAIKNVLKPFLGQNVTFSDRDSNVTAYLHQHAVNTAASGRLDADKAAVLDAYYSIVRNAEYSYSAENDAHSKSSENVTVLGYDYFVSVASVNGHYENVVFAIRDVDEALRLQVFNLNTEKSLDILHGQSETQTGTFVKPNYEASPGSDGIVANGNQVVNTKLVKNKDLAGKADTAIYIKNTRLAKYIELIFSGKKTVETRAGRSLDEFIGKKQLVTDGKWVYGTVTLGKPYEISAADFHKEENQRKHHVPVNDPYDVKNGASKWAYPITQYEKFDSPRRLSQTAPYEYSYQARQVVYDGETGAKNATTQSVKAIEKPGKMRYSIGRSTEVQDIMDRLNSGRNIPTMSEILSIPEIAKAEAANQPGNETINLPNRGAIRQKAFDDAMKRGSFDGNGYDGEVRREHRVDIVIGLPGSGKSSVYTDRISYENGSRVIDTDDFRDSIPEYNGTNAAVVHEEASLIKDAVRSKAIRNGENIILSTIGANAEKLAGDIIDLAESGYRVYLHLNELPNSKSMARAIGRYISSDGTLGRYVSPKIIAGYGNGPTEAYLAVTGQRSGNNGRTELLDGSVRKSGGTIPAEPSRFSGGVADAAAYLAGYDWYNNDVEYGEKARFVQSSDGVRHYSLTTSTDTAERSIIAEAQAKLKRTEAERDRNWRELKELQASTAVRTAESDARIAELKKTVLAQNKQLETQRKELGRVKKASAKAADTAQSRLDAQRQRVADTREKYQAKLDEAKREAREAVSAVKEQAKQDLREADDRRKDELKAKTEQGKRRELREKIQKKANTFRQMALAPQKANTLHAPVALTGALYEFCDIFATGQESAAAAAYNANEQREAAMEMLNEARGVTKGRQAEAEVIIRQRERLLKKQQALAKIRAEYAALKGTVQEIFHDPHVEMLLTELTDELSQKDIPDMNSTELKAVYDTMKAFEYTIVNANKVFMAGKDKTLFGMVDALREQIGNNKVIGNALAVALRRYSMWQMSPDTFFSYICGFAPNNEGKVVQAMFQKGSERSMGVQRDFWKAFREFTEAEDKATKKAMKEMLGDPTENMVDWGLKNANGESVKTSVGMMLQAYMLLTQADSYESLLYGGFKIANAKTYYKGKTAEAFGDAEPNELLSASVSEEAESLTHQMDEAKRIIRDKEASDEAKKAAQERLTELEQEAQKLIDGEMGRLDEMRKAIQKEIDAHPLYQKLIDAARSWYAHSGELLASVYEDMYGYRPNLVDHYTPIHRDLTNVNVDIRTDVDAAFNLENAGLTKERVKSRAPILLTDFFTELAQHTANISRYYGFAQVQHDFNRIWNVKIPGTRGGTIKALVAGKYGTGNTKLGVSGEKYVENYIKAVAGSNRSEDVHSALYGNAASATLSLNPRVAFSQLASIPTAAGEIGWGSMARGFGKAFGKSFSTSYKVDLSEESIWYWNRYRGAGGSTELSDLEMKGTFWAKIAKTKVGKALFNWCQSFDTYATASMWAMAEDYVQTHGMKVSDEGYKAAVEAKYADIIRHTQPNYTVTERSDLLRDKRGGMKLLTMYKTQSNQNLNILMNAIGEWRATKAALDKKVDGVTKADKKAADARLANGITSVLLGGTAVFVALRTLVNFAMHNVKSYRDDDDDEVTFKQTLAAVMKEFGSSIVGMVALGGQAYDAVLAIISGENYYGISDSAVSLLADALDNTVAAAQAFFSGTGSGKVYWKEINSLASLLGIPTKNAEKFYTGLLGWYDDIKAKEWFATTDATTKQLRTQLFNAWKNGDDEKFDSVMAILAAKSNKDTDEEVHKDVVNGFANYYLKDLFTTGKVSRADAVKILEKMNDLPPEDTWADELVNKWEFKMNNPGTELSDAAIQKWYQMQDIPAAEFEKIYTELSDMTGDKDKNGKTISGSLKKKYVEYIQKLNLTAKQKEALWNAVKGNWTDKDTPWDKGK